MAGFLKRIFGGSESASQASAADRFAELKVDLHSHLIPGIDDGAPDLDTAVEMVRQLSGLGYRKLITTPHIMADGFPNTPKIIREGLAALRKGVAAAGIEVEVQAAAEYYLDEIFAEHLEKSELLTFGGEGKYLLFETSYISRPLMLGDAVFRMQTMGYIPVLAHPERYQYHWTDDGLEEIRILRNRGIKMQVNFGSFAGRQGKKAATLAREMAKEGMVDFVGSDLHRPTQVATLSKAMADNKALRMLVDTGRLLNKTL
ncbi:MAG: CpsB/CapC family capsule biosynthesis tyrosine phosphatase [Bacteroidota bacterium]